MPLDEQAVLLKAPDDQAADGGGGAPDGQSIGDQIPPIQHDLRSHRIGVRDAKAVDECPGILQRRQVRTGLDQPPIVAAPLAVGYPKDDGVRAKPAIGGVDRLTQRAVNRRAVAIVLIVLGVNL